MEKKVVEKEVGSVAVFVLALALVVYVTGCGSSSGWKFQIGVTPVTAIDHHETLTERREKE